MPYYLGLALGSSMMDHDFFVTSYEVLPSLVAVANFPRAELLGPLRFVVVVLTMVSDTAEVTAKVAPLGDN